MSAWSDDLQFAQQAGVAVDVRLFNGQHFVTGVESVDEEDGLFGLYQPHDFDDTTTRVRLRLDDITSLTVTHELDRAPKTAAQVSGKIPEAGGGWNFILNDMKRLLEASAA